MYIKRMESQTYGGRKHSIGVNGQQGLYGWTLILVMGMYNIKLRLCEGGRGADIHQTEQLLSQPQRPP